MYSIKTGLQLNNLSYTFTKLRIDSNGNFEVNQIISQTNVSVNHYHMQHHLAHKQFELTNHLGNVLVTISDKKIPVCSADVVTHYTADILSANDYYPYHALMSGRTYTAPNTTDYRFGGSNGQERDDEVSGKGNTYTAEFWEYDARLGGNGRWNVDPKPHPGISPYATFNCNPLWFTDVRGDTTYRFDMKGSYLGMVDLDIAGIRGVAGNMSKVTDANGNTTEQFNPERNFNFNDPALDRGQLNSLKVGEHGLTFLNDENINAMMSDAGATFGSDPSYYTIGMNSKTKGIWDFSSSYLLPASNLDPDKKIPLGDTKGGFFLMGNTSTAYNINDAGNWLWGQAMYRVDVSLGLAKAAAHGNSILLDRAGWDAASDQNAIGQGHMYRVQTSAKITHRMFLANPIRLNANSPKQWGR